MKSFLKGIAVILFFGASAISYAQEFKTPIKVSKGQEFVYQNDVVMNMTQSMAGQEVKVNSTVNATSKFIINNVLPGGNIELKATVSDIVTRTKMPMMDSTVTQTIKTSPTYKIVADKYGNIVSKEKTDTTGSGSASQAFDLENKLTGSGMFCEFPEKNLQPGEKWTKTTTDSIANMGGKMGFAVKTDYTLGGMETLDGKSFRKVSYTSSIEIGGKAKMQGMDLTIEGTGVQNGNMFLDPESKALYFNSTDIELDMNIAISGAQSMTIPMTQKLKVTQKLKK